MRKKKSEGTQETKKMSRTQQRRLQDIIDAALLIFDRDGFEAAKMSEIAQQAEVAKGTLYLYFSSKAELLQGVIQSSIIPTLKAADDTSLEQEETETEILRKQMQIMSKRMASREMGILLRYMMSGKTEQHRKVVAFYFQNVIEPANALLKQTIGRGVKKGEFRKGIEKIDPLVLLGSQIYTTVWKILFEDIAPLDTDAVAEDLMKILLQGLQNR